MSDAERPRRRRDPEATRARIFAAATQEFTRHGYAGARGDRIAVRARCSERMVYYYFGSKDGLYREVLEGVYESLRLAEQSLDLDRLEPRAALIEFCRFVWRYYLEHPEFIGLVNSENLQQARHLRKSGKLDELVTPVVGMLEVLLARGRAAGVFRDGIDANELYIAIAALGYFYLSNTHTLSAVLGRDLRAPAQLEQHWRQSALVVERAVCIDAA
ncbi:MAG TPA: TetR/AcrR family transcriptional regulator [Quisquiliibacterium sp.]|nr:TetR/AcrR family transcriptional regulator [Quisquiliibacterium sp.]HPA89101.1 TetR/AcrR family transcriptional regulator [Quisquiliibacterium sp.]HQN11110.1 TetR/AcrR family transcriptional regulator [Quisquiliibacterium sp.]HQP67778.1 TetR/AcrR family transcriptional regulator [Quisquiliibacterium sp.]